MGFAKRQMMLDADRGWSSINKAACAECFEDEALKALVAELATESSCDYCGRSAPSPIAAPMDDLMEEFNAGLRSEWGDPDSECIPWESAEGGYQGKVVDAWDLIHEEIDDPFANDTLRDEVVQAYFSQGTQWCQRNFGSLRPQDALRHGWREFVEVVKHTTRYLFSVAPDEREDGRGFEEIAPATFLARLGSIVNELEITPVVPAGTGYFRARVHDGGKDIDVPSGLATPPQSAARFSNRMSPAGIPMFYGASDVDTAIKETVDPDRVEPALVTIGRFETARDFRVLDLTSLPPIPSLFDRERRHQRAGLMFLRSFVRDLVRPIKKDGREHIEYVPTQVVSEYFRRVFRTTDGLPVHGIVYWSAHHRGGRCCVLFFENDECGSAEPGWREAVKSYPPEPRYWLGFDHASVETRNLPTIRS